VRKKEVLEEQKGLELEKVEEALDPYSMFIFAMNSPATQKYTGRLIRFLDFVGLRQGTTEETMTITSVNRALDRTKENVRRRTIDEARKNTPSYDQMIDEYQDQTFQQRRF
jgi:hypothetical protein